MSEEEIATVEKKVNTWIAEAIEEDTKVLSIDEARKIGAKALFDEKYGDVVRVVCFGEVSKEFCGGTHVKNTQDIGLFVIESEESVASGVRRIMARTSMGAYELLKKREYILAQARNALAVGSIFEVGSKLNSLLAERVASRKQLESLKSKLANSEASAIDSEFVKVQDFEALVKYSGDSSRSSLASLNDKLKVSHQNSVILLIGNENGSLPIVCSVNGNALKVYKAGDLVRQTATILGGSGGGRPDFASGAGKDASKVEEAINTVKGLLK